MADDALKLASLAGGGLLVRHLLARRRHRDKRVAVVNGIATTFAMFVVAAALPCVRGR